MEVQYLEKYHDNDIQCVHILLEMGPSCTFDVDTLRKALKLLADRLPNVNTILDSNDCLNESGVARLIHFFAAAGTKKEKNDHILSAFLGDVFNGRECTVIGNWDLEVISELLASDYNSLNWDLVGRAFDFPEFTVRDTRHLEVMLALYRSGSGGEQLPLDTFTTEEWTNRAGQLSLLQYLLQCPPTIYSFQVDEEESLDVNTVIVDGNLVATNCINPRGWASAKVLQRLLHLSDDKTVGQKVRDIFVMGLLSCPEIILCALVRWQLTVAAQSADPETRDIAAANAGAGMSMKGELMRELVPSFFKPQGTNNPGGKGNVVRNMPGALCRLWTISQNTVVAACIEAWRSTSHDPPLVRFQTVVHIIAIVRILPSPENAIASILNGKEDPEFSLTVAFVMADHDMLTLRPWLTDRWSAAYGNRGMYAVSLISFIGKNFQHATPRGNDPKPLVSVENLQTTLEFLLTSDNDTINSVVPASSGKAVSLGDSVKAIVDACIARHPSLKDVLPNSSSLNNAATNLEAGQPQAGDGDAPQQAAPVLGSQEDIEECANQYFQQIYASEESARKVVEMLKSFTASGNARENDIFACMIHNLFDEYRFFSKYPEKELRITGILFGLLIKEQIISSVTLGIGLRYVLEALRKSPSQSPQSGKMFRFGMFALEQFKERLHEWPQYCSHIVKIPHLRDGYAVLVGEIEDVTTEGSLAQQAIFAATRELVKPGSRGLTSAFGPGRNSLGSASSNVNAGNLVAAPPRNTQQVQTSSVVVPSQRGSTELETSKPMEASSISSLSGGDDKGSYRSAFTPPVTKSTTKLQVQTTNSVVSGSDFTTRSQPIVSPSDGSDEGSQKGVVSSTSPSSIIESSGLGLFNEECGDAESTVLEEDMGTKLRLF